MATCIVTGNLKDASGDPATTVTVAARVLNPVVLSTTVFTPFEISTATDSSGNFTLTLEQSLSVIFTVSYPIVGTESVRQYSYTGNIPAATSADFTTVIVIE